MTSERVRATVRAAIVRVGTEVGVTEIMLAFALGLLVIGFWSWWRPGAYLAPAAVILWLFIPSRHRFVVAPPEAPQQRNTRE